MNRRDLLARGVQAAAVAPLAATAEGPASADIKQTTVEAAEKIHALSYSGAQRAELAAALPAQVQNIAAVRRLNLPRSLQPAVHFDPRLPGVEYAPQTNRERLANKSIPALPTSDADIAFAPVTHQSHWRSAGR